MASIAIIGTGIAGLGCAHFLHRDHEITVFERSAHVGGHSHTVMTREPGTGRELPIDTGFMVFNRITYPLLCRLFESLHVPVKPTDMSFGVRDHESGIEWRGSSLNHLFAQRRNLFNPRFVKTLIRINRFNDDALAALDDPATSRQTLADYVERRGYGRDFLELYLLPMSAAVWSMPPAEMLAFPAATLLRFFHNHGFLGLHTQHPWWTVEGGAREYVRRLTAPWRHRIHPGRGAVSIARTPGGVTVTTTDGGQLTFDKVVVATHADQALRLLADPTPDERRLLQCFRYQRNVATLHTDDAVMPLRATRVGELELRTRSRRRWPAVPATHYWMNRLQGVSDREDYFVTIDGAAAIAPRQVITRIDFEHPCFDRAAVGAQPELPALNERAGGGTETYFAGSYFRYGFHEDAFKSAVDLSTLLLQRDPWHPPTARSRNDDHHLAFAGASAT